MATQSQLIRYLRACYQADNRETSIWNLFHDKIEHLTFLEGEEDLLHGLLDRVPLDPETAQAAQKQARLYSIKKKLIYGAFPIVGRVSAGDGKRMPARICAPLLFYPATIVEYDKRPFLTIDPVAQQVNLPVLQALSRSDDVAATPVEEFLRLVPTPPFAKDDVHALLCALADFLPELHALDLAAYPQLFSQREVRTHMSRDDARAGNAWLRCVPACAMALIPNSPDTRGVLMELAQMGDGRTLSKPIEILTDPSAWPATLRSGPRTGRVPAVLSRAQQNVVASAARAPVSLIVGPPGTGKSYTIAAVALEHVSRGEAVVIASRGDQAVNVVAGKIEELLGPSHCVLRGGRRGYLRELKSNLQAILHGVTGVGDGEGDPGDIERNLRGIDHEIARLEKRLRNRSAREQEWGALERTASTSGIGWFGWLKHRYLSWQLRRAVPQWHLAQAYQELWGERMRLSKALLRVRIDVGLRSTLATHRKQLSRFLQAIRARTDARQEELFAGLELGLLLRTFPIWLVNLADVSEVLPLEREMFNLAIVDEATQCDMASCLPVFHRAQRIAITGDPNQLRHVSFLSRDRQRALAERFELDEGQTRRLPYREKSTLDLVGEAIPSQEHVIFLDEHFRSLPPIIAFSNRMFYKSALKVMTQRPDTARADCLTYRLVNGKRDEQGKNRVEADALVNGVAELADREAGLDARFVQSIGVLSPFRAQVDYLTDLLQDRLSLATIEKHRLQVGTAHTFQGEERDVMYLSLVVDVDAHPTTLRFLNNPNVFNVSITRARSEQVVFGSIRPEQAPAGSLLRAYLEEIRQEQRVPPVADTESDQFLEEVSAALRQQGCHVWAAYPVAGLQIDLVAEHDGCTLGIDLIGHPGAFAPAFDLERYRMFLRAGLRLLPLPYSAWQHSSETCLAAIEKSFGRPTAAR